MTDEKYINPFTDYGFKKLFGDELNKDLPNEDSLKYYRDLKNSLDTARDEGELLKAYKVAEIALEKGLPVKDISELTGLSESEINKLR